MNYLKVQIHSSKQDAWLVKFWASELQIQPKLAHSLEGSRHLPNIHLQMTCLEEEPLKPPTPVHSLLTPQAMAPI